jgi:hypothetical protein
MRAATEMSTRYERCDAHFGNGKGDEFYPTFREVSLGDVASLGGKNASLGEMPSKLTRGELHRSTAEVMPSGAESPRAVVDEPSPVLMDPILPPEMARAAERIGVKKARMAPWMMLALSVLAGAFISLGAAFSTTVATGSSSLPFGLSRLLVGTVFSLGLILVVLAGAELFTGNNLVVMAWASRKVTTAQLLRG